MTQDTDDAMFSDALEGLHRGDFSRLEPLFKGSAHRRDPSAISIVVVNVQTHEKCASRWQE
jgi:hypothetical protein